MNLPALRREFNRLLEPIYDRLGDLDRRLRAKVSIRPATVTSVDPLRVQFDGDSAPAASTPDTLVPVGPGDRVRVLHHGGTQYTIAGVVGTAGIPWRQAAGSATITGDGTNTAATLIAFPAGRFAATPALFLSVNNINFNATWGGLTTGGATVSIRRMDYATFNNSLTVHWHAVQMTPTSAEG